MEFIRDDMLPGLKLFLTEDDEKMRRWYVFEEDFADDQCWGESARKIVGCITIFWEEKRLDFHVNDFWFEKPRINHQRKGYGTRIMYYIENVLAPQYPDFEITINNYQEYLDFKEHIEEKIRASLNIVVFGNDEALIQTLEDRGYKKIYNMKSYAAGLSFLEEQPELVSQIHYIFYKNLDSFPEEYRFNNRKTDLAFSSIDDYCKKFIYPAQKDITSYYRNFPRVINYEFEVGKSNNMTCDDYMQKLETNLFPMLRIQNLTKEPLPMEIPVGEKKEIKDVQGLSILCLSSGESLEYYINSLKEKGIKNVSIVDDNNYSLEKYVSQLGNYDVIIGSNHYSSRLLSTPILTEIKEQTRLKGHNNVLVATYNYGFFVDRDRGVSGTNEVKYCLLGENEDVKKEYSFQVLCNEPSSMYDMLEDYGVDHCNFETVFLKVIETIIREYFDYINSKGASIPCDQFSSYLELQAECDALEDKKQEENQKREAFYSDFDTLHNNVLSYLSLRNNTSIRRIEEVSVEEKNDYVRICFLLNGICKGAVSIPKKVQTKGRIFTMEIPGKNGALLPSKEVILLYPGDEGDNSVPTLSENELRLLQGICKRVKTYVTPLLEESGVKKKFVPEKKKQNS